MTARATPALALLSGFLIACFVTAPSSPPLLSEHDPTAPAVRAACALTGQRCIKCHTLDRVLVAQVPSPRQWESYVNRMRRMRESGISRADGDSIVTCLVYRSFGPGGLAQLRAQQKGSP